MYSLEEFIMFILLMVLVSSIGAAIFTHQILMAVAEQLKVQSAIYMVAAISSTASIALFYILSKIFKKMVEHYDVVS